jgi:dihydrofolate reductase
MNAIVAISRNGVIGKDGKMPWHISEDLRYFKQVTAGHVVVMGRKTYESIGALPLRHNIVLTRDKDYQADGCEVMHSVEEVVEWAKNHPEEKVFIIGGAEIYKAFMPYIQTLYLTRIDADFEGDTVFDIHYSDWIPVQVDKGKECDKVGLDYYFLTLQRAKETSE